MMKQVFGLLVSALLGFQAAAQQDSSRPGAGITSDTSKPEFALSGRVVTGYIVIYGADLDGKRTASGELLSNVRLTIASDAFPLQTWLLASNPANGRSVVVRVSDRLSRQQRAKGAAAALTKAVAEQLGIIKVTSTKIKFEKILPSDSISFYKYYNIDISDSTPTAVYRNIGKAVTGIASYYSANLDGTLTSTGERYRNHKLTAASNHFKLNTWVRVTNIKNGKSVIVRINDRMHPRMKRKGRVVDMSQDAARILDYMNAGLAKVLVQPVELLPAPLQVPGDSIVINLDSLRVIDSVRLADSAAASTPAGVMTGTASFYSAKFDGRKTSTGAIFRNAGMTAASNDFPLNTWVRVTNLRNDRSVIVKINDRMHKNMQRKGRIVDLTRAAAKKLGFIKAGLTRVRVEVVEEGTPE